MIPSTSAQTWGHACDKQELEKFMKLDREVLSPLSRIIEETTLTRSDLVNANYEGPEGTIVLHECSSHTTDDELTDGDLFECALRFGTVLPNTLLKDGYQNISEMPRVEKEKHMYLRLLFKEAPDGRMRYDSTRIEYKVKPETAKTTTPPPMTVSTASQTWTPAPTRNNPKQAIGLAINMLKARKRAERMTGMPTLYKVDNTKVVNAYLEDEPECPVLLPQPRLTNVESRREKNTEQKIITAVEQQQLQNDDNGTKGEEFHTRSHKRMKREASLSTTNRSNHRQLKQRKAESDTKLLRVSIKNPSDESKLDQGDTDNDRITTRSSWKVRTPKSAARPTFPCTKCGIRLHRQRDLRRHMEVHNGNFVCSACGVTYKCKRTLAKHFNTAHCSQ